MEKIEEIQKEIEEKHVDIKLIPQQKMGMIVDVDRAVQEWQIYQELTKRLLDPSDYQKIQNKMFKKKSAWRKYARAFNISTTIIKEEIKETEKGQVTKANFIVRAISPDGRYCDGWGNCSKSERRFSKPNHDIPATAETRAYNRAVSNLIGAGEVSAEEMEENINTRNTSNDFTIPPEIEQEIYQTKREDSKNWNKKR